MTDPAALAHALVPSREDADIAAPLLAYLRARIPAPDLSYRELPSPILGGFDTSIYSFALDVQDGAWRRPLIARVFRTAEEGERAQLEAAVQNAILGLGFPAPEVLVAEPDASWLGRPFIVMHRLPGQPMLGSLLGRRILRMAALLGRSHARLHALDAAAFDRVLKREYHASFAATAETWATQVKATIERTSLDGLRPSFAWAQARIRGDHGDAVVCHGDFHPLNVLVADGELAGVVDWAWVVLAPPEFDVGATIALLTHGPVDVPRAAMPAVRLAGRVVVKRYLRAYAAVRPLRREFVRVYESLRLLGFLCEVGEQMQAEVGAVNADMRSPFAAPAVRDGIVRRLRAITGVDVTLPESRSR